MVKSDKTKYRIFDLRMQIDEKICILFLSEKQKKDCSIGTFHTVLCLVYEPKFELIENENAKFLLDSIAYTSKAQRCQTGHRKRNGKISRFGVAATTQIIYIYLRRDIFQHRHFNAIKMRLSLAGIELSQSNAYLIRNARILLTGQ